MDKLKPLFPYLRPYRVRLVVGVATILLTATLGLMAPLVIGSAIDALRTALSARTLLAWGALLVGITLIQGLFHYAQRKILVTMSRHVEADLANDFFAHLETLEPAFFQSRPTGDLMARATNDLAAVRMLCGPAIMYSSNTLFAGTGALLLMFRIHVGLTLVACFSLPLVVLVTKVFGARIHDLFTGVQEQFSNLTSRVQESLSGGRVIRAYVQEEAEEQAFAELDADYLARQGRLIRWQAGFRPLLQSIVGLGFAAVLWYGGWLLIDGVITVGQFVTFQLFLGKLVWPMIAIGWVINIGQRGAASMGRLSDILTTEPAIRDAEEPAQVERLHGALRFDGLTFRYADDLPAALEGIDLDVPAGRTVAVVGRTGAGKSTLLQLVPRLVDPPPGQLHVDGVDVRLLPLAQLRRAIAMVPQETFLFSATLRQNIAFGRPEADEAAVLAAAELAGLITDLAAFPAGLETRVGERGITLSGGQKQRVALARALLREPRLLLLDDCLSAVDTETEERILRHLREVFTGRTVLFVSHRTSAARMADEIVVLDGGRIAERGSHAELLAQGGLYADLDRRQRLEEELSRDGAEVALGR